MVKQRGAQVIAHRRGGLRHSDGEVENEPLGGAEQVGAFVIGQRGQGGVADAGCSAYGRADVESEGTPDQRRRLDLRE